MQIQTIEGDMLHVNPACVVTAHETNLGELVIKFADGTSNMVTRDGYDRIVAWMDRIPHV